MPLSPLSVARSRGRVHLVTGATGFVGGALVLALLERTDDDVVAVARAGSETAEIRLRRALLHAAEVYGSPLSPTEISARCRVVAGDVLAPGCGVGATGPVDQVWHCAASLKYDDRFQDEIAATNIGGTRHVLELAARVGATGFHYVSTAYVAGRRQGRIAEAVADHADPHNQYERTKIEAERLVAAARGLQVRIFRPGVVVGHSRTLAATTFSGFYGFVRQLVQFRGMMERTRRGLLSERPLQIRLDPAVPIDLVSVDAVAEEMVAIGLQERSEGVYHLTHPAPATVGVAVETVFRLLDLPAPSFVAAEEELAWLDARFGERLDFYGSYLRGDRRFERVRTDGALRDADPVEHVRYDAESIEQLGRWYLARLEQERRRLPAAR